MNYIFILIITKNTESSVAVELSCWLGPRGHIGAGAWPLPEASHTGQVFRDCDILAESSLFGDKMLVLQTRFLSGLGPGTGGGSQPLLGSCPLLAAPS